MWVDKSGCTICYKYDIKYIIVHVKRITHGPSIIPYRTTIILILCIQSLAIFMVYWFSGVNFSGYSLNSDAYQIYL